MAEDAAALALKPMRYFSHDSDANRDIKCRRLIARQGVEGYGRWWLLCEALASTDNHRFDWGREDDRWILTDEIMYSDQSEAQAFLSDCAEIGLINPELWGECIVTSDRMNDNALYFGRNRANGAKGARSKWDKRETAEPIGA